MVKGFGLTVTAGTANGSFVLSIVAGRPISGCQSMIRSFCRTVTTGTGSGSLMLRIAGRTPGSVGYGVISILIGAVFTLGTTLASAMLCGTVIRP